MHARVLMLLLALASSAPTARAVTDALIETPYLRFALSGADGRYELTDKSAGVTWRSNPFEARFGEAVVVREGKPVRIPLSTCEVRRSGEGWTATFEAGLTVSVRGLKDRRSLEFAWSAAAGVAVESVRLLDEALWVAADGGGCVLVPVRLGLRVPADSGKAFRQRFDTYSYEGCHMAMFGVVARGAAALVTWTDPYTALEVHSTLTNRSEAVRGQVLASSLTLSRSARSLQVRLLGKGDENTVALAYREVARERGWLVTWDRKLREHPAGSDLFGASNYKLWSVLDRRMSEDSQREERVTVNWTFDEAAQMAEHLKRDLQLDRVLFSLGGWIHRGYDNQHPDILPAAPECGGDEAFADCCRRVRAQGYVLGLHDNYQDIYRDSPSWDEKWIMRQADGALATGGHWAGGRAYLTCSRQALELARRPQNLEAVRRLSGPAAYFIDTTYASGLMECFDANHPLTRLDDLRWKQALSDYARGVFGLFGSECGREWAVPHADFFEGLTGVSGHGFHNASLPDQLSATGFPLFEIVYHDAIAMYGKYGYDIRQAANYVLEHLVIGRPLHYHNVPAHLYWRQPDISEPLGVRVLPAILTPHAPRQIQIRYAWHVERAPTEDWRVFVHFTDANGRIRFQNDHTPRVPTSAWTPGPREEEPLIVQVPEGLSGILDVRVGLFQSAGGARARLAGRDDGESRYLAGRIRVADDRVLAEAIDSESPAGSMDAVDPARYAGAAGGWAEGLHPYDRFVKNTHELLSPVNRLTAQLPLQRYEYLTEDRSVRRSSFGRGRERLEVVVNLGSRPFRYAGRRGGDVLLPPGGFLAEGPSLVAFCATRWAGIEYETPTLFVAESRDDQPLERSRRIRVFHGFGGARLRLVGRDWNVPREAVLDPRTAQR